MGDENLFHFFQIKFGYSKENSYLCPKNVISKEAKWECFADIKKTFNSVDSVGNKRYVFNIKGNDYRLIVLIKFTVSHVLIRFVGTHKEYDKIKDIQNI